jgi:hypothetical protein
VSAPSSATVGTPFTVTATAQDQFNNPVTGYNGTVQLTSSTDPQAVIATVAAVNGIATFSSVTLKTAGSQTIKATDTTNSSINGTSGSIAVAKAATALTAQPATDTRPNSTSLPITGLSATLTSSGNPVAGKTITFTNASGSTTLCTAITNSAGTASGCPPVTGGNMQMAALAKDLRNNGYKATFTTDSSYLGSTATATITQLN